MKKKGISLIVLIITIIVIIILATSIIVNLAKNNIIYNANIAVIKNDLKNLQVELDIYVSDRTVDNVGNYDRLSLNADYISGKYKTEDIKDTNSDGISNIYDILTNLKDTYFDGKVTIIEGELIFTKNELTEFEKDIIKDGGYQISGPKIADIVIESDYTEVKVTVFMDDTSELNLYKYYIDGNEVELIDGKIGNLEEGKTYKLKVVAVLSDGTNISKELEISTKEKEPINLEEIKENASSYFGKTVNYISKNGFNNWKLFYVDNDSIYLIAGDYVPVSYFSNIGFKTRSTYFVASSTSREDLLEKLTNTEYYIDFLDEEEKAEWVVGGPSLEMFANSWEQKGYQKIYYKSNSTGYKVGLSDPPTENNISISKNSDDLYLLKDKGLDEYGYWITSPSAFNTNSVIVAGLRNSKSLSYTHYDGRYTNSSWGAGSSSYAIRPIVKLKSETKLVDMGNNTYDLK